MKESSKMLKMKITVNVIHNTFDGLIGRLDTAEERTNDLEHMPTEIIQTETQREKGENKNTEQSKFEGQYQMIYHMCNRNPKRKRD